MGRIRLDNIRLFAHHGCLEEETLIGSDYRVDLEIIADLDKAALTDVLIDTVDYVHLHKIVQQEMAKPSKLLEHVAQRILQVIFKEIMQVQEAEVTIAKINPPLGGDVGSVAVTMGQSRVQ